MANGEWVPVWLVHLNDGEYVIRECEGRELDNGWWIVNTRGKGCRSKMFEPLPAKVVYTSVESAERRRRELEQDST